MAVMLGIGAVLLLVLGLAVRFSGGARLLNFVDYANTPDAAALHAWVGTRLLLLGLGATGLAALAWRSPGFAILCVVAFVFLVLAALASIMVGAARFQRLPRGVRATRR